MTDALSVIGVAIVSLVGVLLTLVRLPGTWLIIAAAAGYGWLTGWQRVGLTTLGILAAIALAGEVIENIASALLAHRAGASRQAIWGALIGGFVGMFVFTIPLPIIGTTIGALLGCFVGALVGELAAERPFGQSSQVGAVSAAGFILGVMFKTAAALAMTGLLLAVIILNR